MGIANWLHWCAWFTKYFTFLILIVAAMTLLVTVDFGPGAVFIHCDASLLFCFLLLYTVTIIFMCFAVSVCFKTGTRARVRAAADVITASACDMLLSFWNVFAC